MNHQPTRRCLLLLVNLLVTLGFASQSYPANQLLTPLSTDKSISYYVGIRGSFRGIYTGQDKVISREYRADVCVCKPDQELEISDLECPTMCTGEPLSPEPRWRFFTSAKESFELVYRFEDKKNRLYRVVISNIETHESLAQSSIHLNQPEIKGAFIARWEQPYYQIDGFDRRGKLLFTIGASHGRPDGFAPLFIDKRFVTNRPASLASLSENDHAIIKGRVGDPYSYKDITINQLGKECSAILEAHGENDRGWSTKLSAPIEYQKYVGLRPLSIVSIDRSRYFEPLSVRDLEDYFALTAQDKMTALENPITMPPYSVVTGQWYFRFFGYITGYLIVPNRVNRDAVYGPLIEQVLSETKRLESEPFTGLSTTLESRMHAWIEEQRAKGLNIDKSDVKALGDYVAVMTINDLGRIENMKGIQQEVTLSLANSNPSGSGVPVAYLECQGPVPPAIWVDIPSQHTKITFDQEGVAKLMLLKGFRWKLTGIDIQDCSFTTPTDGKPIQVKLKSKPKSS